MQVRLITIGDKLPKWVNEGFADYLKRLPKNWNFELIEIPTPLRTKNTPVQKFINAESERILKTIDQNTGSGTPIVIALEPTGKLWNNQALLEKFQEWQTHNQSLNFIIGGPDGLSAECLKRAQYHWSLSNLVLPHGLARLVVIEQLYRTYSLLTNHPYHR